MNAPATPAQVRPEHDLAVLEPGPFVAALEGTAARLALLHSGDLHGALTRYRPSEILVAAGVKTYISSRKLEVIGQVAEDLAASDGSPGCVAVQANLSTREECDRLAAERNALAEAVIARATGTGADITEADYDDCGSFAHQRPQYA